MEDHTWTQKAFSMNRQRFEHHDLYGRFFDRVVPEAIDRGLMSEDHFTIDGTRQSDDMQPRTRSHSRFSPRTG